MVRPPLLTAVRSIRLFLPTLFLVASPLWAQDGPPGFVLEWGLPGSGQGEFEGPRGIATNANCEVYVVDTGNDRVQKFDANGTFLLEWGTTGSDPGEFRSPIGIDVAPNGNVYVVDSGNDRIQIFDPFGSYIDGFGGNGTANGRFRAPSHIQCEGATVWITDTGNSRVQRLLALPPYNPILSFGTFGSNPSEFQRPYGITLSPNGSTIYVTDLDNTDWTQVFDNAGVHLGLIGSAGIGNGEFTGPRGLDVDGDGEVYVAEGSALRDRVQKFAGWGGGGVYRTQWGVTGALPGEFLVPEDVAVCGCLLFVTDRDNGRVQRFDNTCVAGAKWDDLDQDGIRDLSEAGLPGWTIELRDGAGAVVDTRVTDAAGDYLFMAVAAGTYILAEQLQPAWYQTAPLGVHYPLSLSAGTFLSGLDFGNAQEGCFEPQVWLCPGGLHDQFDSTNLEPTNPSASFLGAISGLCGAWPYIDYDEIPHPEQCFAETQACWPESCLVLGARLDFRIGAAEGDPFDDTIAFWQGGAAVWSLAIADLPGAGGSWLPGQSGVFSLDLAALPPDAFGTTNVIACLQDGDLDILIQNQTYVDYLDLEVTTCCNLPAQICGTKFHDANCNGVWDAGEPPLAGWEIGVAGPGGSTFTQFTDVNGNYCFPGLAPGHYYVHETLAPGWVQTAPPTVIHAVDVAYAQTVGGLDFGNVEACADTSAFSATFGIDDDFDWPPEPSNPGPELLPLLAACSNGALPFYDALADEQCFGETLTGWPSTCTVLAATVCMKLKARADQQSDPETDSLFFYEDGVPIWGISMNALDPVGDWAEGDTLDVCLDLASLPVAFGGATNILAALHDGNLDVFLQDDTGVDYITIDLTTCCDCAPAVCCTPPPAGLCAWYPGDATSPVVDLVSAPANGTLLGGAVYTAGIVGDAILFDGDGDRVHVPDHPKLDPSGAFTLDAWIRADDLDAVGIETFVEKRGGAAHGYWIYMRDGYLGYTIAGSGGSSSATSSAFVADEEWHLIALTVATGDVRLYLDGGLVHQDTTPTNYGSFGNSKPFQIGGTSTGEDFAGVIDEVEYFRRALADTEIQALFAAGASGKCRETASTTQVVRCTPGIAQVTISAEICNYGPAAVTYDWALGPLPVGTGCDVPGPTNFLPSSGTVTVNPGACVQIFPIFVDCPTGMADGERACWEFRARPTGADPGDCDLVAHGEILFVGDDDGWDTEAVRPLVEVEYGDTLSTEGEIAFEVSNRSDAEGIFDYEVREAHADADLWPVIGLEDGEPGVPVTGRLLLAPGESEVIRVRAQFLRCSKRIIHQVVLSQDLPGTNRPGDGSGDPSSESTAASAYGESTAARANYVPVASVGFTHADVVLDASSSDELPTIGGHLLALRALPTPFARSTQLSFELAVPTEVRVEVFDTLGRRVRLLQDGVLPAGPHALSWNGRTDLGKEAVSGAYFVRLRTAERSLTRKVLLMR